MVEVVIRAPGQRDRVLRLTGGAYSLGRAEDNDIVLEASGVSRHHARMLVDGVRVWVEDRSSGNGTFVRGEAITGANLADGDEIFIEPFTLRLQLRGATDTPRAWLQRVNGAGVGTSIALQPGATSLGRGEDADVIVADPGASRRHAVITGTDGQWIVRDENSANGIYVNERRVKQAILNTGDELRIGGTRFALMLEGATTPAPAAPAPRPTVPPASVQVRAPQAAAQPPSASAASPWVPVLIISAIVVAVAAMAVIGTVVAVSMSR